LCPLQTFSYKSEPGLPPPAVEKELNAFLDIDDFGDMRLSLSLPNGVDPSKLHLTTDDLVILTNLFNSRVKTNPFRNPTFSAFAHLVQTPPHFIHEFVKICRFADGLRNKGDPFQIEIPFFGGYSSDYRGILNEVNRTRIGFTMLLKYSGDESSIAIPIVWNYKSNTVDVSPTEEHSPVAKVVLGATIDEPNALRQILSDPSLQAQMRTPSELIFRILEWWKRRFAL
jgi:hypothetical protein